MPLRKLFVVAALSCAALPSTAMAQGAEPLAMAFSRPAQTDEVLASVHGTGLDQGRFMRTASRDDWEALGRFSAQTLPLTFDNWFNDVGTPLIVANLSR